MSNKENRKLTEADIEKIITNMKSTLAIENLQPSNEVVNIIKDHLRGYYTEEQALNMIDKHVKGKYIK